MNKCHKLLLILHKPTIFYHERVKREETSLHLDCFIDTYHCFHNIKTFYNTELEDIIYVIYNLREYLVISTI